MSRRYRIPTTTAIGLTLSGCTEPSIIGQWDITVFDSYIIPMTGSFYGDLVYSLLGSGTMEDGSNRGLTVSEDSDATLQIEVTYSYESSGDEHYDSSYVYAYGGSISRTGERRYSIELADSGGEELNLSCVLRGSDMLDCDEVFGEDVGEVFLFERE